MQALATQEGPIVNWTAHTVDPVHANVLTNAAKGFGLLNGSPCLLREKKAA